ncbi:transcriptional regulator [Enterococcus sp. CR-Ec1]|jgi:DNA-binding transcriptional MerR regulator|nr:transcriptional regulator [Enterococcus sp. CR-Ec1]EPH61350.1 transcriptional regulator, MerR family [Enterococcus faecium 13.SD.W.09]MBO1121359.1 MerR family transcriptional regulator [Enterococcus casseliflavus]
MKDKGRDGTMKIKQVSENYDITPHTLRYYEQIGLLSPNYTENGYRDYSYEDIERLNTIRDLRFFDVSLEEIKNYLDTKNKALTKEILHFEMEQLEDRIHALKEKQDLLKERIDLLVYAEKKQNHEIERTFYEERYLVLSQEKDTMGKDLYFELKRLHKQFEKELHANNQNVFGTILLPHEDAFRHQVFYCLANDLADEKAFTMPAGEYLAIYYTGTYKQRLAALAELKSYLKKNRLVAKGNFYEFYLIDFHETNLPEEYVSKIEILLDQPD